jgi:hypothetical protein
VVPMTCRGSTRQPRVGTVLLRLRACDWPFQRRCQTPDEKLSRDVRKPEKFQRFFGRYRLPKQEALQFIRSVLSQIAGCNVGSFPKA